MIEVQEHDKGVSGADLCWAKAKRWSTTKELIRALGGRYLTIN